jgi:hypothetical protein
MAPVLDPVTAPDDTSAIFLDLVLPPEVTTPKSNNNDFARNIFELFDDVGGIPELLADRCVAVIVERFWGNLNLIHYLC